MNILIFVNGEYKYIFWLRVFKVKTCFNVSFVKKMISSVGNLGSNLFSKDSMKAMRLYSKAALLSLLRLSCYKHGKIFSVCRMLLC